MAAPCLSCDTPGRQSSLQVAGSLSSSTQDLGPLPRIEPGPLCWEHVVLAAGPPGESLEFCFGFFFQCATSIQ